MASSSFPSFPRRLVNEGGPRDESNRDVLDLIGRATRRFRNRLFRRSDQSPSNAAHLTHANKNRVTSPQSYSFIAYWERDINLIQRLPLLRRLRCIRLFNQI